MECSDMYRIEYRMTLNTNHQYTLQGAFCVYFLSVSDCTRRLGLSVSERSLSMPTNHVNYLYLRNCLLKCFIII